MARAAKKVTSKDAEITCTSNDGLNVMPTWTCAPETRAEFIENVSRSILGNVRDWDVLKNGKTAATAAYGMAVHLADLLGKRDKGD